MDNIDSIFVRTSWEILDVLHQTQTTADGLAGCLDILCKARQNPYQGVFDTIQRFVWHLYSGRLRGVRLV